jgi:hypothetical protein
MIMQLVIERDGLIRCIYDESIDLQRLGATVIKRASHVEPTASGTWTADLTPVGGPILGPYLARSQALNAEVDWLNQNWISINVNGAKT